MQARDAADYGKPEPRATGLRRARGVHAVEALKDALRLRGRNPHAMVLHDDFGLSARLR